MTTTNQTRRRLPIAIWIAIIGLIGIVIREIRIYITQKSDEKNTTSVVNVHSIDSAEKKATQVQQTNQNGPNQIGLFNNAKNGK